MITARSRGQFKHLLSERGYRGNLQIDHRKLLLDLQVEPDETRSSGEGRQTKTLSGGEKSFSMVCLLLSLWEAMGSPIRCLDEFDVFMDNINRDVALKMIVSKLLLTFRPETVANLLPSSAPRSGPAACSSY
jgi:structural maintenance of chromosomes protein 6